MSSLTLALPQELGICQKRWSQAVEYAATECNRGTLPALSFQVQRKHQATPVENFGSRRLNEAVPLNDETLFLVASLTKPMVAMATMLLAERGALGLNQRIGDFFPECRDPAKRLMTLRHLLTHTSGLPDMLPNNFELRKSHAPHSAFVDETLRAELNFPVGRGTQYQSMGYALLASVIEKAAGVPCPDFMRQEIFEPLGMNRTWLGLPPAMQQETNIAEIRVPEEQQGQDDWNWNSPYWRALGASWGGILSTTSDLSRFLETMLSQDSLFSQQTILEATTNRLDDFPLVSESDRRTRGWGMGWRLNWKEHRSSLCELMPATTCGHWGATGTLFWFDRSSEIGVVILSNQPVGDRYSPIARLSNMLASAFVS